MNPDRPLLSICVPTYKRPEFLQRALRSIAGQEGVRAGSVEIVVVDNEQGHPQKDVVKTALETWPGRWSYHSNETNVGMVNNWNEAVRRSSGEFILILHDDDYLLPGGLSGLLDGVSRFGSDHPALLFGVEVVNDKLNRIKKQIFSEARYLTPAQAVFALFTGASFVRFPAMVLGRSVYEKIGFFDPHQGLHADYHMWLRVMISRGVICVPAIIAAYVIHRGAATGGMFNEENIVNINALICSAKTVLGGRQVEACRSAFLNRFVLGGTYRAIKNGQIRQARKILGLLKTPTMQSLENSAKWKVLRAGFRIGLAV